MRKPQIREKREKTMENAIEISDADFDDKVLADSKKRPVLVDFWAPWCGPCRMLGPVMEKLAKDGKGKFLLAKLNVEDNPKKAQEYGVRGIPSVKMFKGGEVVAEFVGARGESEVKTWLEANLGK